MRERPVTIMDTLLEHLIETGPDGMARVFTALFELAMRTERDHGEGYDVFERAFRSGALDLIMARMEQVAGAWGR